MKIKIRIQTFYEDDSCGDTTWEELDDFNWTEEAENISTVEEAYKWLDKNVYACIPPTAE